MSSSPKDTFFIAFQREKGEKRVKHQSVSLLDFLMEIKPAT